MNNSIQYFIEFGVKEIGKAINNFIEDGNMNIGEFVLEIGKPLLELQRNIISETIEDIDVAFRESEYRKKRYHIERSNMENSFISTCGEIKYKRTYYKNKKSGEYVYLADKACGISGNMRKSDDVVVEGLKHAVDSSYRISGEHATKTDDVISKQAVMKDIHELDIPQYLPLVKEKKKVKKLYINADEDHVALQYFKEKGDTKRTENRNRRNTVEPRIACIFEGIETEGSCRKRLTGKHYVCGVYSNSEGIWEEVLKYIDHVYEEECIEKIYIMGDGASWIKKGTEILGSKSRFVLDKFHLRQYIYKSINHLEDSTEDIKDYIYNAIRSEDKECLIRAFNTATNFAVGEYKKEEIRRTRRYIHNNWDAIVLPNNDEDARIGCSAEGQVSHMLSSRLSSRPLGWSVTGVDKISRIRAYCSNGGNVWDLVKYKEIVKREQLQDEIREKVNRDIRGKRKIYTDVWNRELITSKTGKVTGMYCLTKKLKGICNG